MTDLFDTAGVELQGQPLADRLRPKTLQEVVGQDHLLGPSGSLTRMLAANRLSNLILWGPPGSGKTTLARLIAPQTNLHFEPLSAIFSGVQDLKKVFEAARVRRRDGVGTLLFVDEIHRFNRAQQDSFLPVMEDGTIVLVGATTENPSFELNSALLSRAQVFTLNRLDENALEAILVRAEEELGDPLPVDEEARHALLVMADGDGRTLLNLVEEVFFVGLEEGEPLKAEQLAALVQRRAVQYDKNQDGHYNLISALHKSVRGSDPDAALYWLARMLAGGEEPLYLCRRFVRMASEDIGLADPNALQITLAATETYKQLGSPEGELAIAQACIYLATAPKSNAVYTAYKRASQMARQKGSLPPPKHILNAPTSLMKDEGYGAGYQYDHDTEYGFSGQSYFPEDIEEAQFYHPVERGFEREIKKRLEYWENLRKSIRDN